MSASYERILVTGAAGFMGSHLVNHLVEQGHTVFGLDDLSGGYEDNVSPKSTFTKLDLRDRDAVKAYITDLKPDLIYHLAADATEGRSQFTPLECTERNYMAHMNLLVPAIANGLKRIVVTSSMSVYGAQQTPFHEDLEPMPEDVYGISKAAMEKATEILASVHDFEYVIIRPHNVYGPNQNMADPYRNVVAIFINRLLAGKPFYIYGDGEQKRSFTYIDDCVPPLLRCGFEDSVVGARINIGPGPEEAATINELAEIVLDLFFDGNIPEGFDPIHVPDRPREVKYAFCTHDKATELLGYKPQTTLRDGIAKMIEWARPRGHQQPQYLDEIELTSPDLPKTWKDKLI